MRNLKGERHYLRLMEREQATPTAPGSTEFLWGDGQALEKRLAVEYARMASIAGYVAQDGSPPDWFVDLPETARSLIVAAMDKMLDEIRIEFSRGDPLPPSGIGL